MYVFCELDRVPPTGSDRIHWSFIGFTNPDSCFDRKHESHIQSPPHKVASIVIQELEVVVRRYVFPRRPWSPCDTNIKLENYIISDK